MIELTCDNCGSVLRLGDEFAGRSGRCPDCHAMVTVPEAPKTVGPELPTVAPAAKTPSPRFNRSRVPLVVAIVVIVVFVVVGTMLVQSWLAAKKRKLEQWAEGQGDRIRQDVEAVVGDDDEDSPEPPSVDRPAPERPDAVEEQTEPDEPAPTPPPPPTIEELLQQTVASIELDGVMLVTVLDYLRDIYGLPLQAEWRRLAEVGVTRGMRVTISAQDVTVADVLTQLLDGIGSAPVNFDLHRGSVRIATQADMTANTIVRLYSVVALIPVRELNAPGPEPCMEPAIESAIGRITVSVAPDKWESGEWDIRCVRYYLVITATPEAHPEIAELIEQILQDHEQALQDQ